MSQYREQQFTPDQWGRVWEYTADAAGEPVSGLQPYGWTAPQSVVGYEWVKGLLVPPTNYVRLTKRERGKPRTIFVDMDAWIGQQEAAEMTRQQDDIRIAQKMDPDHYMTLMDKPTADFRLARGPNPFPPIDVLQAMLEGDDWALGLTAEIPEWVLPALEDMLYSANAGGLLAPSIRREIRARERRDRLATVGKTQLPGAPANIKSKQKTA